MAKYSDIKGFTVQTLSTDTITSQFAGGAWASSNDLNTAMYRGIGTGTQTAGLVAGGYSTTANTEQYNGSSWTEVNDLNTARVAGGNNVGTYSATLYMSGATTPWPTLKSEVEQWDGTSWTEIADVNTARRDTFGCGSTTAAIMAGGYIPPYDAKTEQWNGSSWTEVNDMNTARLYIASMGTSSTAGLAAGGAGPTLYANVEQWDGTNWTEVSDISTASEGRGGSGSYTEAIVFGGYVPSPGNGTAVTEHWNGSSWTEIADLATARYSPRGQSGGTTAGAASAAWVAGGYTNTAIAATEEFTAPATFNQIHEGQLYFNSTTNTFKETILDLPAGTWASNTAAPTASTERWGTGTSNSNAMIGSPPGVAMEWNGSSWTNGGTVNSNNQGRGGTGGITAALIWGGTSSPAVTEEYNGTAWTEKNDLNTGGNQQPAGPTGTYTDLISAGRGPGHSAVSESWNGTSWTETADLNTARRALGSSGASSTDCAVFGGNVPPNNASALTETWNGTAWTETTDLNTLRFSGMGFGNSSQTAAYVAGGSYPALPPYNTKTEVFNGTTWTEVNDLPNGRYHNKGGGSASSALTAGGYLASPAGGQTTENLVWEANLANKTITAS